MDTRKNVMDPRVPVASASLLKPQSGYQVSIPAGSSDVVIQLNGTEVTIAQKVGENDQLFGSVTSQNIADMLEKKGFTIERRKIQLDEPIRTLGAHKVSIRLHREVTAEITVNVVKEEE